MKSQKLNFLFLLGITSLLSCENAQQKNESEKSEQIFQEHEHVRPDNKELEEQQKLRQTDNGKNEKVWNSLVDVQTINPSIFVDLRYASENNFMKIKLYDTLTKAYLQRDVAIRLSKCQEFLTSVNPNLYLLVYDAVRPVSVQWKMWNALDSIPVNKRVDFVSNPKNRSIHNYGAAVDITLCDKNGVPLDMGAEYDDIRQIAYPSMEEHFLQSGELSPRQVENRKMLRKVMTSQNFRNIPTEWWHFNACSRSTAKAKYLPLF